MTERAGSGLIPSGFRRCLRRDLTRTPPARQTRRDQQRARADDPFGCRSAGARTSARWAVAVAFAFAAFALAFAGLAFAFAFFALAFPYFAFAFAFALALALAFP